MPRLALIIFLHLLPATLFPAKVTAGFDGYLCTINEIRELSKIGNLPPHTGIYSSLIGSTFSINRMTGEVIGLLFDSKSYKDLKIIDRGSQSNSFKLMITSYPPNVWIKYIYVEEFQLGEGKPFWGTDDGDKVYAGICK